MIKTCEMTVQNVRSQVLCFIQKIMGNKNILEWDLKKYRIALA